jgi:hypothetical protein
MWKRFTATLFVFITVSTDCYAKGLFDFLDPCIAAKEDYWAERNSIISTIEREKSAVESESATPEFRDYWWKEKKKLLREYFDENMGDIVKASGGNADRAFEIWLAIQIKKQGGMNAIDPIIQA